VRPSRQFIASPSAYELRDPGPAGGWIYYISGDTVTYFEAAPVSLETTHVWSNPIGVEVGTSGCQTYGCGKPNTAAIVAAGFTDSAAKYCADL